MFKQESIRYWHYNKEKLENGSKDKAITNKTFESIARNLVLNGKLQRGDYKPRKSEKLDCTFFTTDENGCKKRVVVECKCGCGVVKYFESDGMGGYFDMLDDVSEATDDMVLSDADYVVFMLEADPRIHDRPELVLDAFVLPRLAYVDMLHAMSKTGKLYIKLDKAYGQLTVQSMVTYNKKTGKYSDKPLQRAYDFVDNCPEAETLAEFLTRYGREF